MKFYLVSDLIKELIMYSLHILNFYEYCASVSDTELLSPVLAHI